MLALVVVGGCKSKRVEGPTTPSPISSGSPSVANVVSLPQTPVGRKLEAWLAGINSAERAQMVRAHAGESEDAIDEHVAMDTEAAQRTGGFDLDRIEEATLDRITLVVRARRTRAWRRLAFRVALEPPHTIAMIHIEPIASPTETSHLPSTLVLDASARAEIIDALIQELDRAYVFPDQALAMGRALRVNAERQAYETLVDPETFARTLTEDLRSVSHDKHLRIEARSTKDASSAEEPPKNEARVIGDVRRLAGNVAYVEILTFGVPRAQAQEHVRDAMRLVADAAALVIDVRKNGGGDPETAALVSSYLFGDEPVHLNTVYWRVPDKMVDFFTDPKVAGSKFGPKKPVYVLTSARTFSGAEDFAYSLQALKRAIIVGEVTGGGAHPGRIVPLPHGLRAFVPSGRSINPITKGDWEGTGVKPDVPIASDQALETAVALARKR
jgi:hypothetical protein